MEIRMRKAVLAPVYFSLINEREAGELKEQLKVLENLYGDVADFLEPVVVGEPIDETAEAIVFPQMIFEAFRVADTLAAYDMPMIVLTSKYGTVEMWDWEIVTYLREKGMTVFSPYNIELAKTIIRGVTVKAILKNGARFLMFQDSPGEGKQANIFKRFYWYEKECTQRMADTFGIELIYRSWGEVAAAAKAIPDEDAKEIYDSWEIHQEGVCEKSCLSAAKLYMAVKNVINEIGGVEGVGCNCLNESMYCDTTPCLAWNMIFEKDDIIWACEGDTLTLLSTFILYRSVQAPIMMTNLYPFLVGMAALAHEKIDKFPEIDDPDNHCLGVHCGYFGFAPRQFCSSWTMRPKVLEIVDDNAIVIDAEFPKGDVTLAKIYPDFKRLSIIEAEIEDYVGYPGSDCLNGALIRYKNGNGAAVMENLCSHHSLILVGNQTVKLQQLAKVFGWETVTL